MAEFYDGWEDRFVACPDCAWVGYGKDTQIGGQFRDLFERVCPSCSRVLFAVTYPTVDECKSNLDRMSKPDRLQLEARERFLEAAAAAELLSPDQLPELPGDEIVLAWDREHDRGTTVIRHGPIVVWREVSYYEGYDRFREVLRILSQRYGARLLDLIPTVRSMNFLFGDRMSAPGEVDRARFDWDGERQKLLARAGTASLQGGEREREIENERNAPVTERDAYQHTTDDYGPPLTNSRSQPLTTEQREQAQRAGRGNLKHVIAAIGEANREEGLHPEESPLHDEEESSEPAISQSTLDGIWAIAAQNSCTMVTSILLRIWQADNPYRLVELERTGKLIPLVQDLMPALDVAQDLRAEYSNMHLADHEILQMAELPLRVPSAE